MPAFFSLSLRRAVCFFLILLTAAWGAKAAPVDVYSRPQQVERSHDFDVLHYRIELTLEETEKAFEGKTTVRLRSLRDGFDRFILDAETFIVEAVTDEAGAALDFTHADGALAIVLLEPIGENDIVEVTIVYKASNVDVDGAAFGMSASYDLGLDFKAATVSNPQLINTLSFPEGARHWFPCYDHPGDRASQETIVTVRADYQVISNGKLLSATVSPDGSEKTFHWFQERPHPTYLFVLAAGPYKSIEDRYGELPLRYWVYPDAVEIAPLAFGNTPEILQYLEDLYGVAYPWIKYDQITIPGIGGGAESTTATVVGDVIIHEPGTYDDFPSDWLVAHEAAHQWWGNLVGYRDWTHMWLSESFATYSEYRYAVHAQGMDDGAVNLLNKKESYLKEAHEKYMRPIVFDRWNYANDNFDRHGYQKGAVVLHMLCELIGEEVFREILKIFLVRYGDSAAVTEDFIAVAEAVSGEDLRWFFDQWLFKPGHPEFEVFYLWDVAASAVRLHVKQVQDTGRGVPIFRAPIKIAITTASGTQFHTVQVNEAQHVFDLAVEGRPLMVRFDAGDVLLKEWTFTKSTSELLYQAQNDTVIGRIWSVRELGKRMNDPVVAQALVRAANGDTHWAARRAAVEALGASADAGHREALKNIAQADSYNRVRASALAALANHADTDLGAFFAARYAEDGSYLAKAEALKALGAIDDGRWTEVLEAAQQRKSPRDILARTAKEALQTRAGSKSVAQ